MPDEATTPTPDANMAPPEKTKTAIVTRIAGVISETEALLKEDWSYVSFLRDQLTELLSTVSSGSSAEREPANPKASNNSGDQNASRRSRATFSELPKGAQRILAIFERLRRPLRVPEIVKALAEEGIPLSESTVTTYMTRLSKEGLVVAKGRGDWHLIQKAA